MFDTGHGGICGWIADCGVIIGREFLVLFKKWLGIFGTEEEHLSIL